MAEGPAPTSTASAVGTQVKKEALPKLLNLLSPAAFSWDLFAQQIGVPPAQIALIKVANPQTGPTSLYQCFTQALEWWQANHENPVYETMIGVLDPGNGKVTPVMNRALAKELREFMAKQRAVLFPTAGSVAHRTSSGLHAAVFPMAATGTHPASSGVQVQIMNREKPGELTMPCLGRPFQLGMLYDCRSDQLVSSIALWNEETLKQARDSKPQTFSSYGVIADNSTKTKLSELGVNENLKLSFLAGLVDVSGAASYLNDQTSSKNQVRISLRYHSTAQIDRLSIEKLGDLDNPDVFEDTTATHFVSGVLYGADAFFVFDQEVSHDEKVHDSRGFMKEMVESLPTICTSDNTELNISGADKKKVQKFHCKLYCDIPSSKILSTFEQAVKLCKELPKLLSENNSPIEVWLYPLSKLNAKVLPIAQGISAGLVAQTQDFMEAMHKLEMRTSDLMNSEVCTYFVIIKEQLSCFKRRITAYKVDFAKNLATLIPKIRGGVEKEDELSKCFREKDASPFSHERLSSWIKGKESEVKVLKKYLNRMKGFEFAFLPGDMNTVVSDPEYQLVISLTFTAAGQHDPNLENFTAYLQKQAIGQEMINPPIPWYNNPKIINNMKVQTRLFESFAKANEQAKETKFVVTSSSSDELTEEGAVIELYEDCKKELFELPSQPGKPTATSVTHSSIQVKWSKPEYGSQNVKFYTVFYCDLSSSPEQWKIEQTSGSKDSITVEGLGPQKKYCFKVQAVCKAGVSEVSEVSEPILTDLKSIAPGKPIVSSKSHNGIQLQWSKAQYGEQDVDFYTISCHETKDSPELESHCKKVKTECAEQFATVSNLLPQTSYRFKVHAKFRNGANLDSDISDPIQTHPMPVPPGKPIAANVTYDSIRLEWSEAQYGAHNIEFYTICYHQLNAQSELDWKQIKTTNSHTSILISNLVAQREYSFEVHAEFNTGVVLVSEASGPLQTHPSPVPPGKPIVSCVTHNSVHLEWSKPQYKENVECYTIFYQDPTNQEQTWKEVKVDPIHKESVKVSSLAPCRKYSFKVCAKFKSGMDLPSDSSDPVQTYPTPVPPGKPTVSNVSHNSVQLKWSKAQCAGQNAEFYTVSYHETLDTKPKWTALKTKCTAEYTALSGLAAQTQYSIKVHAKFKTGESLHSEISDPIQTYPAPVPPGKPTVSNVTHNSVHLEWSEAQYGRQSVEFYTVFYSDINDRLKLWKEVSLDSPKQSVTIDKLASQTVYSFKVQAHFKAAYPICSEISDPIQTCSPPVPPGKPTASSISCNSIQLEWSKAQYGTQSISYTVFYYEFGQMKEIDTPTSSATVKNLKPQTEYQFKVTAIFRNDVRLFSDISDVIKTCPPPEPPGKPTASTVTHDEVELKWSKSHYGGENAEFYTIFFTMLSHQPTQWKQLQHSGRICRESLTVHGLLPNVKYCFKVHANFKAGIILESEASDLIQAIPPPVPPGNPIASKVTHNSVHLKWTEAHYGEYKVQYYTVMYCEIHDSKENDQWTECISTSTNVTLRDLSPLSAYCFKIQAKFEDSTFSSSEIGDTIQTLSPPTPPGKPFASSRTHNNVQLKWAKPDFEAHAFHCYTVFCKSKSYKAMWKEVKVDDRIHTELVLVCNLAPATEYFFKVNAVFDFGTLSSEISDPICTHTASVIPGKPFAFSVTHNTIELQWPKPVYGAEYIMFYTVLYREMRGPPNEWKEKKSGRTSELISICGLGAKKEYYFKIRAELKPCDLASGTSETSKPIKTKYSIALQMISENPTKEGPLDIHKLSMVEQMSDKRNRIRKCEHKHCIPSQQKVLLVVGATGAGKTTLINAMINYILKVEWKDCFRFKLITEEEQQTQVKSQTKWITAYTLPRMEGSPVPYTLTVIDTPGFGDTEGLERDKEITRQIKEFFSKKGHDGIDHIDGIGFVTQSALARLTPTQRYICNSILAIFGKDVADNLFMMVTFADGQNPPAIKDAAIPCSKFYNFNNSALFASNHFDTEDGDPEADNFDRMFWEMGEVSFKRFFADFYKAKPVSLQLTREVLELREQLEITVRQLHPQIRHGLAKIEEMRQEEEVLQQHEAEIAANKDFTFVVDIAKSRKVDLQGTGIYVMYCLQCNFACHKECKFLNGEDKYKCSAMDRRSGLCTVCPGKCKWDRHVNRPYRFEDYVEKVVRTSADLERKYHHAVAGKKKKESMIIGIDSQLKEIHHQVLTTIKQVQRCLHRLDEIALKPNPPTKVDFLELRIDLEKQQAEPGWKHRVQYYETAKEKAVVLQCLQAKDVVAKMEAEQDPQGKPRSVSWYSRFSYWVGLS